MAITDIEWDRALRSVTSYLDFLDDFPEGEVDEIIDRFGLLLKRYGGGERSAELYNDMVVSD